MLHNDVLRSVRHMLRLDEPAVAEIVRLGGGAATPADARAWLLRDDEPGYVVMGHAPMACFLDGLITHLRGPAKDGVARPKEAVVGNNDVLKKLRVAFALKEDDLIALMTASGFAVSRPELSALFRAPGHHNYRPCGDQFLRNFLKALTARVRG
jgi:uncharacterized protein YehS (DUF1456 family)